MPLWPFEQVECFAAPYKRRFVSPRCSAAYCFHILCIVALVLFPIFASFASSNVWVKEGNYREQPLVSFAHELLIVLDGGSQDGGPPQDAVGWSSRPDLQALLPAHVRVPAVRSSPMDMNHDGVPDTWRLSVDMPVPSVTSDRPQGYRHVFLLAVYNFRLREKVSTAIGGLLVLDLSTLQEASGVWVQGQLKLRQTLPLRQSYEERNVYANNPLDIDPTSNWATANYPISLRAVLERYAARNETVHLEFVVPPVWDYAPRPSFKIDLTVDVPPQLVYFVPSATEVLKWAWVQVLSFLIPTWFVLNCIKVFAFERQIVETYVVSGLPVRGLSDS